MLEWVSDSCNLSVYTTYVCSWSTFLIKYGFDNLSIIKCFLIKTLYMLYIHIMPCHQDNRIPLFFFFLIIFCANDCWNESVLVCSDVTARFDSIRFVRNGIANEKSSPVVRLLWWLPKIVGNPLALTWLARQTNLSVLHESKRKDHNMIN